jgi:hypothetical protein
VNFDIQDITFKNVVPRPPDKAITPVKVGTYLEDASTELS